MFSEKEKKYILDLAKQSIEKYFKDGKSLKIENPPDFLKEKRSCFVTLKINDRLRGCIGHIEPIQALHLDICENAQAAAFHDPRFLPLTLDEYSDVQIEVSVLSVPVKLEFFTVDELLEKLRPCIDGVILRRGSYGATYLPQVWEDLMDKKAFLSSLCEKAGLTSDDWKKPGLEILTYQAEILSE